MYGTKSVDDSLPAATMAMETAGLNMPPEMGPPIMMATANAAPMAIALPVAKMM
jgi:hypothetical protein